MRHTILFRSFIAALCLTIVTTLTAPSASAAYTGETYFDRAFYSTMIADGKDGTSGSTLAGSVIPNKRGPLLAGENYQATTRYSGAGAVGNDALGITDSTNNRARKEALYNLLRNRYTSGTDWERMGSAVVVNLMTRENWGQGGRSISEEQWEDLYNRLVENDDVLMRRNKYYWANQNTIGVTDGSRLDARRYTVTIDDFDAWVFSVGGNTIFALEVVCANPLGNIDELPPADQQDLVPRARPNRTVTEPGSSITVLNEVENREDVESTETIWRLTKIEYRPGTNLSDADRQARDNNSEPCLTFPAGPDRVSCNEEQRTSRKFAANATITRNPVYSYAVPTNDTVGTRVCFVASVSRPTGAATPVWRHSTLRCVMISKKPKVQVWGGDIRVGGGIDMSTSTIGATTYGSWAEYGVLSNRTNDGLASGSGLNGGNASDQQSMWSRLTFANAGVSGNCSSGHGCFGFLPYAPSLTGQFSSTSSATPISGTRTLNGFGSNTYSAGNLAINESLNIAPGRSIIIVATGTVTIRGSITYTNGPYTSIRDIPQVVIKARTINIENSATTIDAWLLASESINTCSDVGVNAQLSATICNNPLRVNGPVVTDTLYLRRTAGSSGTSAIGDPAEIFNLRADAYLWSSAYGTGNGKVRTVYTKELPPRF